MTLEQQVERYVDNYWLLSHWLESSIAGVGVREYFDEMNYRTIAVYGMGELANRLSEDLAKGGMEIAYGIDRDVAMTTSRIANIYALEDEWPMADVIVVTPFYQYDAIRREIGAKCNCPIVSLEEVIWSL